MNHGWKIVPMGELCSIKNGKSNAEDAKDDGEYAFFDRSKKIKKSTRYLYDCEALIIPGEGAEFLPRHFIGKFDLHQRAYALFNFSKNLDVRFLFYYLTHFKDYFVKVAVGATVKSLRMRHFEQLPVPLPPLPEQQRIVAVLDQAFAGIAKATDNAKKNLQNARELFDSHLQSIFATKGDGWVEKSLGECFRLKSGDGLTSKAMQNGAYPVFGGNGIAGNHNEFNLSGDNVIIGRVGALCGNARHIREDIWLTDNAFKVVDFSYEFDNAFLTYLLNHKNLRSLARQAAQPVISNSSLKDLELNFPPLPEQQRIVAQLDALSAETKCLEAIYQQKLDNLAALKQSILQKAFAGELNMDKLAA